MWARHSGVWSSRRSGCNRQTAFSPRGGGGWGRPPVSSERLLAYHPIVLGDQVIVGDGTRVLAFNLNDRPADSDGSVPRPVEPAWKHDPENGCPGSSGTFAAHGDPAAHAHGRRAIGSTPGWGR